MPDSTDIHAIAVAALPSVISRCAADTLENGESIEQMLARKSWAIAREMIDQRMRYEMNR